MKLTAEEARDIVFDCSDDWSTVQGTVEVTGKSRWSIYKEGVFLHKPSNKYYLFEWQVGATEMQDEQPYEYVDYVEPTEVVLQEVVVKQWVPVQK
jgi:hypothetical protein